MSAIGGLLSNAIKFTHVGGVFISVEKISMPDADNIELKISVRDTGEGISKDKIHILFEPFTQVSKSSLAWTSGTGLGLTISKRLIEMMHGNIGVETEQGNGSTFWFTLKLGISHEKVSQPPFRSPPSIGTFPAFGLHPFLGPSAERKSSLGLHPWLARDAFSANAAGVLLPIAE